MPWIKLGATVGSSLLGSLGSSSAARKQQEAAAAAARLKQQAFEDAKQLQMPFYQGGADAFSQLTQRLPALTQGYDPQRLLTDPGYQFGLDQGQQSLERSLAARGLTNSGAALKAAARYGTDYSTTKLGEAFDRDRATRQDALSALMGVSGFGQRAGDTIAGEGMRTAGSVADDITGASNVAATNDLAQGNIWSNLLNQGASTLGRYFAPPALDGKTPKLFADGGRVEPVVGTRAPRRAGGTGGMDRQAVLDALDAAWRGVPTQPGTVAALPTDPTRNPRAIVQQREQQAGSGGYARGGKVPGAAPGKADTVHARLSGGEHVMDAEVVAMLGDGNSEAGHALLEELKQRVRAMKRSAPADRPAAAMG